jgi:hypothetical protein
MKITKTQLKKIIKEELGRVLNEASRRPRPGQPIVPCEEQPNSERYTEPTITIGDSTIEWVGWGYVYPARRKGYESVFKINGKTEGYINHELRGESPLDGSGAAEQIGVSYPEIDMLDLECWATKMFELYPPPPRDEV